ncbi:Hsp70 family protein [Luteipulveratus halotolerans]|uniref:Uncharacterized protein n=1 Tax=Luteipulveratus halotolerans TaxID=1631356 RepID=A0A0L6CG17_9MICO|nr:Hsp70 family protein [Luteipulveratus halotolerans]KNX36771.1 hypothetical protein VV01_05805 [Luteipulveratus halotolerans]
MDKIGIEVGTAYTRAVLHVGGKRLHTSVPSAVAVDPAGDVVVGEDALARIEQSPSAGLIGPSRRVGDRVPFILSGRRVTAESLLGALVAGVIDPVLLPTERDAAQVSLVVPDEWDADRRASVSEAVSDAGYPTVRCVGRAAAALVAHGLHADRLVRWGGQTYDAVVVNAGASGMTASVMRPADGAWGLVQGCSTTEFGADDLDDAIVAHTRASLPAVLDDPPSSQTLHRAAREARTQLGSADTARVQWGTAPGEATVVSASTLETGVGRRLRAAVQSLVRQVDDALDGGRPSSVVLIGAAATLPLVVDSVAEGFGHAPLVHVDPELTAARGALRHPAIAVHPVPAAAPLPAAGGAAAAASGAAAAPASAAAPDAPRTVATPPGAPAASVPARTLTSVPPVDPQAATAAVRPVPVTSAPRGPVRPHRDGEHRSRVLLAGGAIAASALLIAGASLASSLFGGSDSPASAQSTPSSVVTYSPTPTPTATPSVVATLPEVESAEPLYKKVRRSTERSTVREEPAPRRTTEKKQTPTPRTTTPRPTTPKPPAPKPTTPKPTAPKPTAPKPTTPKPTAPAPTAPKPTAPKPTAPKPPTQPKPSATSSQQQPATSSQASAQQPASTTR